MSFHQIFEVPLTCVLCCFVLRVLLPLAMSSRSFAKLTYLAHWFPNKLAVSGSRHVAPRDVRSGDLSALLSALHKPYFNS
jgi:hypothetical protein